MQHWNLFLYLTSLIPKLTHKKTETSLWINLKLNHSDHTRGRAGLGMGLG